jgi:hypothetical protein
MKVATIDRGIEVAITSVLGTLPGKEQDQMARIDPQHMGLDGINISLISRLIKTVALDISRQFLLQPVQLGLTSQILLPYWLGLFHDMDSHTGFPFMRSSAPHPYNRRLFCNIAQLDGLAGRSKTPRTLRISSIVSNSCNERT